MLVLTGTPGVGKHTVSEELAKTLDYEIVDVNKEAIKAGMSKRDDSIDVDVEQMQELLKGMLTEKSLIVGHLAVYVISKTRVSKAIVLRKNPYDLIQIYEKRNYTDEKKNDNLGSEVLGTITYDSIKKFGNDKTFQVNTTSLTTEQTVKKIVGIVCDNSDGDTVDWLTEISKKNDFKKFFPD
ncbi:MAG TPA: shikimate kinase [Candidatus Nitrosopelagicus sp.]|jgi:adenylate kinase|nr:shikimate kinase [Candidatus Nitrosopelagicus sp.]